MRCMPALRPGEPRMKIRMVFIRQAVLGLLLVAVALPANAAPKRRGIDPLDLPEPVQRTVKYFGDIHPLLAEKCVACHGPEKQKGGLRLDSREMALAGGESYGPAIVPGKSEESPLLLFMAHLEPGMEMPPKQDDRLQEETVSIVRAWIDQGAEWPATKAANSAAATLGNQELFFKKAATHWAFQPVVQADDDSLHHGAATIDRLVDSIRQDKGLASSPRADAATLLKRLHFDLTGLPPSAEEMNRFVAACGDHFDAAVTAEVDELLASPHFGERWGRYWLDIARYADAQDLFPNQDLRYPFAWTYRDYVIGAFNADKPYDQFLREQIAADLLGLAEDDPTLAALGLLTVGPRFLRKQDEQINDRIDVVTRGLMGLTVACARCHDHKFDPIPTTDFYALYGVFQSSVIPDTLPLIALPSATADPRLRADYEAAFDKTRKAIAALNDRERSKAIEEALTRPQEYFDAFCDIESGKKPINTILNTTTLSNVVLGSLGERKKALKKGAPGVSDAVLGPLAKVLASPAAQQAELLRSILESGRVPGTDVDIHPLVFRVLREKAVASEEALVRAYGAILAAATAQPDDTARQQVREAFKGEGGLLDFSLDEVEKTAATSVGARGEYRKLHGELAEIENTHPGAPVRAMVLKDVAKPVRPVVFVRGDAGKRGEEVDRRFLEVLDPTKKPFSPTQSGRKELAERIASPANPLTPRVWANQVWRHLLGRPLVKTTSDFGLQSESPTHPQLLDWLASALVRRGWSTKRLVRDIVLSATYQQSSADRPDGAEKDPDNDWLWRANRRRLDLEAMRDAMLVASGRLDPAVGGRAVPLSTPPFTGRRTVYGFVDRVHMDPMFITFDFPSPDTANTERAQTTVPQQALFALNDAFIIEQARVLAAKAREEASSAAADEDNDAAAIRRLYRRVFQRAPLPEEEALARRLLADAASGPREAPRGFWQAGVGSADPQVHRAEAFVPLAHFDPQTNRYQGSRTFPDRQYGFAAVSEGGGHPGDGIRMASIRRWVVPYDGEFALGGDLSVGANGSGDGVRGRVISCKAGLLGEWVVDRVNRSSSPTIIPQVRLTAGEIVDFTVDCRETTTSDSYRWAPTVRSLQMPEAAAANQPTVWDAKADFKAPPPPALTPLEQMAQALLMTNEFMFVE
jgi:mono/diheme cytochrome c family protein